MWLRIYNFDFSAENVPPNSHLVRFRLGTIPWERKICTIWGPLVISFSSFMDQQNDIRNPVQNLGRGLELVAHVLSGLLRLLSDNSFCAIVKKVRLHETIRLVFEGDKKNWTSWNVQHMSQHFWTFFQKKRKGQAQTYLPLKFKQWIV